MGSSNRPDCSKQGSCPIFWRQSTNILAARIPHLINTILPSGHRAVDRVVHLLRMVRSECPSVATVSHQLFHGLTVKTAQHGHARSQCFIYNHSPFIRERRKNENSPLRVKCRQLLVRNTSQKSEPQLGGSGKPFEFFAQRPLSGNPQFTCLVWMFLQPV